MAPAQAVAPIEKGARVAGAVVRTGPGETYTEIAARWTILACGGASADVLEAFGVLERRDPSAMAARIYVRVPAPLAATLTELHISFERSLSPGYGWVFPGPDDTFNVGVGIFGDTRRAAPRMNLRELMDRFCTTFLPARQLLSAATATTRLLGAPLRTGLTGAQFGRAGLLVAGEAAGTTYSLTGEGIGKALATGTAAGETVAEALASGDVDRPWEASYRSRVMSELGERFRAYKVAQEYLASPVVADYLAWRARTGRFARVS
jgi:flavin-dependent dehydrogenase